MIRSMLRALWKAFTEPLPPDDGYDRRDSNGSIPPPPFEGKIEIEIKEEWIGPNRYAELQREEEARKEAERFRRLRVQNNPNGEPVGLDSDPPRCTRCYSEAMWSTGRQYTCACCGLILISERAIDDE